HLVTSEMVLAELLNDFSARDPELRRSAAQLALRLREMPDVTVFPQTTEGFQEALSLYLERYDKSWSLTDCASFRVMREQGLEEALTYDKHFDQAGFKALLR
ncbi:MAG: PIN domain-containing protein, partial [Bdellovibrionota bacterium]